jgi:pimeloyl-ACP methyl ester carboxylesterase
VVQAGDLGYLVARSLASKYPQHIKAYLLNNAAPAQPTAETHPDLYAKIKETPLSVTELAGLARSEWFSKSGDGYIRQQATRPQTIGYLLTDSPVGLLAWLYEKLHDWTDNYAWSKDEILTWVSIYYFSRAGPAATSYIYYEVEHADPPTFVAAQAYSEVPLGVERFPKDLILLPKAWNQTLGPVVFEREYEKGGHFAAWERPDAVVGDLRSMFGKGGAAYEVVKGKNGFV